MTDGYGFDLVTDSSGQEIGTASIGGVTSAFGVIRISLLLCHIKQHHAFDIHRIYPILLLLPFGNHWKVFLSLTLTRSPRCNNGRLCDDLS